MDDSASGGARKTVERCLITDNCYSRNKYAYPLNIEVVIDGFGLSRNVFYCLMSNETKLTHQMVLKQYTAAVGNAPAVLVSDRDKALIAAARAEWPTTHHIYCFHHLSTNLQQNLAARIVVQYNFFVREFYLVYNSVSPEMFNNRWEELVEAFPQVRDYLQKELYPCRAQWARAWIQQYFTAGVRTNGRVERENRFNKRVLGPTSCMTEVFQRMNQRTEEQSKKDKVEIRQVRFLVLLDCTGILTHYFQATRQKKTDRVQATFPNVVAVIREHCGPFALHRLWQVMDCLAEYVLTVINREPGELWVNCYPFYLRTIIIDNYIG